MNKTKDKICKLLDSLDIDYEINSLNPGITTKNGKHLSYDDLSSPKKWFK